MAYAEDIADKLVQKFPHIYVRHNDQHRAKVSLAENIQECITEIAEDYLEMFQSSQVSQNSKWYAIPSIEQDSDEDFQEFYIVEKEFWDENGCCQYDSQLPEDLPNFGSNEDWSQNLCEGINYNYYGDEDPEKLLEDLGFTITYWGDHPKN